MYQILTLNKISASGLSHFSADRFACSETAEQPDAVIVRSASMHEMDFSPNLLAIARAGAGVNNIPIDRCTENGICVFNTPGANANAVKELVICSLFLASRKIAAGTAWCETLKGEGAEVGKKVEKGKSNFVGPEILGKTLGVIGLGAIGILVANAAVALGMHVIGYDPFLSETAKTKLEREVIITSELDKLFSSSDYITVHTPLNDATRGIIGGENLAMAKDGVRILNFARGELVDNEDILDALHTGKVSAYVTDFPTDDQLGVPGVTAIPHLGASTPEAEENCAVMAVEQLSDYLLNGNVKNSVNLPALSLERNGKVRLTVVSKGDISASFSAKLSDENVIASGFISGEKKGTGYLIADTNTEITDEILDSLKNVDGVLALRIL